MCKAAKPSNAIDQVIGTLIGGQATSRGVTAAVVVLVKVYGRNLTATVLPFSGLRTG